MSTGHSPAGIDHETVAETLTAFVNTTIMASGRSVKPDDEFELMGIDSMAMLKVLLFVEATFGFWMPDEDLVADNLASPRALARYICRRRGLS
jgi:acyl carrier protein